VGEHVKPDEGLLSEEQLLKLLEDADDHREATVVSHQVRSDPMRRVWNLEAVVRFGDRPPEEIRGEGNGTIAAFVAAVEDWLGCGFEVRDYAQQTLSVGTDATAISYVWVTLGDDVGWGVASASDTVTANFDAILSALSRIPDAWERLRARSVAATGPRPV
jgi:hypothetical protein